jgi:diacylglycerol kinase
MAQMSIDRFFAALRMTKGKKLFLTKFVSMINKLIRSFGYAFKGLAYATKSQLNFRIHLFASVIAIVLGFTLNVTTIEWLWISLSIAIVLLTELINTGIETLTDLVSPDYNEKAGHVKDICAGAVVVAACFALITGIIIFLPKIIFVFHHAA